MSAVFPRDVERGDACAAPSGQAPQASEMSHEAAGARVESARRIVMLGTSVNTMGGIAAVVSAYRDGGLFDRWPIDYLATHVDGGVRAKLRVLIDAWLCFMVRLVRGRIAALHVHTASDASFWRKCLFLFPAFVLKVPVVLHLHGAEFDRFYEKTCGRFGRAVVRWVFDHAHTVVVLSTSWQQWVGRITANPRVVVVRNPVVLPESQAGPRDVATILFLGRIGQRKGTWDLLEAIARLGHSHPSLRVCLGGDGEASQARALAQRLGIADRVETPGWLTGAAKAMWLARATVYALPSYAEGLPMSVLEAMAAGMPVVATPVGGIGDVVSDGAHGLLVAPGDVGALAAALARLLDDAGLRDRLGHAARVQAETLFSLQQVMPCIEAVYRDCGVRV